MFKLIIWDFDGVIADSEKIWLQNRCELLNDRYGLNWDFDKTNFYLGGQSDKTKQEVLEQLGINTDTAFWEEAMRRDYAAMADGLKLTPGVKDIFACSKIKQCIATGGVFDKTQDKLKAAGIQGLFPTDYIFTADMVQKGKPEPDLFLLAAEKMGEKPQDCLVIEDSLAGMTAGLRAGMETVAFVGCEMNQSPEYIAKIKALGIKHIFWKMSDLQQWLCLSKA